MVDHAANIKKYDAKADDAVVASMMKTYRLVLSKPDSALVSFGDPEEVARVRTNFVKKKLGVTDSDADIDAAIAKVGEQLKGEKRKDRLVVYYLLAKAYNKLDVFA